MDTYAQMVVEERGAANTMRLRQATLHEPSVGQVRIKVLAAGVSAYDAMIRSTRWLPGAGTVPYVPGLDVVGTVDAVGPGASNFEHGQMVAASTVSQNGGGYAEYVCLPTTEMVPVPDGVDPEQAVCLITNYLTAHLALHETAKIEQGEQILVHGAAGGVGSALLDLGRLAQTETFGTARVSNHEVVTELGATPIDTRIKDVAAEVRRLNGDGVDVVFDPVGGTRQLVGSYRALREGGRLVWFGVAASARDGLRVIPLSLVTALTLKLIPGSKHVPFMADMGKFGQRHGDWFRDTLTELLRDLAAGRLHPIIAEAMPLDEAWRAHELVERGGHAGKFVLIPSHNQELLRRQADRAGTQNAPGRSSLA